MEASTRDGGEYLSLLDQICKELESHSQQGSVDPEVAELIVDLGQNSETFKEFNSKLKKSGADLPDYLVSSLLKIVHTFVPPFSGKKFDTKSLSALIPRNDRDEVDCRKIKKSKSNSNGRRGGGRRGESEKNLTSELDKLYKGKVSRVVVGFGCFVKLDGFKEEEEGFMHASEFGKRKFENFSKDQEVYVKLIDCLGGKLNLSMRNIEQQQDSAGKDKKKREQEHYGRDDYGFRRRRSDESRKRQLSRCHDRIAEEEDAFSRSWLKRKKGSVDKMEDVTWT